MGIVVVFVVMVIAAVIHPTLVMIKVVHVIVLIMMVTVAKPDTARKRASRNGANDHCQHDLFYTPSRDLFCRNVFPHIRVI